MQIPLDRVCVKSGVLCDRCQAKIDSGEYAKWEVDVMRVLLEFESKFKELRNAVYRKSVMVGDSLYIVLANVNAVSRELPRAIAEKLGLGIKRIVILSEGEGDIRTLVSSLINAPVLAVNMHYLPDNSVSYVALVPASERRRVEAIEDNARRAFRALRKAELYIEYTQQNIRQPASELEKIDKEKLRDVIKRIGA